MNGRFGFWEILALAAAVQGLLLAAVVCTHRRGNRLSNRLLGALLLLYSVQLIEIALHWARTWQAVPRFCGRSWFFPYLYGPLLYLYAHSLNSPRFHFKRSAVWHLAPEQAADAGLRLIDLMTSTKPYREPDLRLGDLAVQPGISPHHVSQVINQQFNCNFNSFVNRFRVEEAQRLIADPGRRRARQRQRGRASGG